MAAGGGQCQPLDGGEAHVNALGRGRSGCPLLVVVVLVVFLLVLLAAARTALARTLRHHSGHPTRVAHAVAAQRHRCALARALARAQRGIHVGVDGVRRRMRLLALPPKRPDVPAQEAQRALRVPMAGEQIGDAECDGRRERLVLEGTLEGLRALLQPSESYEALAHFAVDRGGVERAALDLPQQGERLAVLAHV